MFGCGDKKVVLYSLSIQSESPMSAKSHEFIGNILSSSIPREMLLSIDQRVPHAVARAERIGEEMDSGHRGSASGYIRHLLLNEALSGAFRECGIPHQPLKGNGIVSAKASLVTIARAHMGTVKWNNARRSKKKVQLCGPNFRAKDLVLQDLFEPTSATPEPFELTVFIVTEQVSRGACAIYIVVTDERMDLRNPVFREPLHQFMQRYQQRKDIVDQVTPKLKGNVKKLHGKTDDRDPPEPTPAA